MYDSKLRCTHQEVCVTLISILYDQGKSGIVYSLENNHFICRLAYIADIFQQLNKVNLKLQVQGRTIFDFIDTLSAFDFIDTRQRIRKNLTIGSAKIKQELLLCARWYYGGW